LDQWSTELHGYSFLTPPPPPGPAPEGVTNKIYDVSKGLQEFVICPDLKVDLSTIGTQTFQVASFSEPFTGTVASDLEVVSAVWWLS